MWETNFLQSSTWAEFQRKLGHQVIEKRTSNYSYVAIVEKGQISNRLYCPLGPLASNADSLKEAIADLKAEARKLKLDFIRIEPTLPGLTDATMKSLGLKKSHRDVQPPHTVISRVDRPNDEILLDAVQTRRHLIRKCATGGIKYKTSYNPTDIHYFIDLIHEVADRTGMRPHDDMYFQQMAAFLFPTKHAGLLTAELDGKIVAALIFICDGTTMTYLHAASATKLRKISPSTGLVFYAVTLAHSMGCKYFDWCGVAPDKDDRNPRWNAWAGFTEFKLSFGGQRVDRIGTWELPLNRKRYLVYRGLLAAAHR